ncbi:MAG: methyltransferase [Candidatus Bathyarchaeota archaeon]|nr:methyltransferase [Candidatus Bathyarchaeota archaeon]
MNTKKHRAEHYFTAHPKSKLRFGLLQTSFCGRQFKFITASGVFSKERVDAGTRLLIESMVLPANGKVLDIGCGYGAVGIAAAVFNPDLNVVMVDLNDRAVRLARRNAELNRVWNAEVRRGYLYEPVADMVFDCVLSNPPVSAGMETVERLITDAPLHMTSQTTFQMVVRSKIGGKRLLSIFEKAFGNVEVLARESGYRVLISRKQ